MGVLGASARASILTGTFLVYLATIVSQGRERSRWGLLFERACPTQRGPMTTPWTPPAGCPLSLLLAETVRASPAVMLVISDIQALLVRTTFHHVSHSLTTAESATVGFQSSALARPRATNTTFPPGLDLRSQYRPMPFANLQNQTPDILSSGFQSAPLRVPGGFGLHAPIQPAYPPGYEANAALNHAEAYHKSETFARRMMEVTLPEDYATGASVSPMEAAEGNMLDDTLIDGLHAQCSTTRRRSFTLPNTLQQQA